MEQVTQLAAVLIALAVLKRDFDEGRAIAGAQAGFIKKFMWGFVSFFDDLTAAGMIIGLLRIASGGGMSNLLWVAPWAASTFLILRSAGAINWDQFLSKLADDISDGFLLASVVIFWLGWGSILIPNFTINF